MKFEVTYAIAYQHVVTVGLEADSAKEAQEIAEAKFDEGTIWDDTPECRLLYDDYQEQDCDLLFGAIAVQEYSVPDYSVRVIKQKEAAFEVCRRLLAWQPSDGMEELGRITAKAKEVMNP